MAGIYDDIDLKWSWNGDYSIGPDGDLADTSDDLLESLRQEIHTICASEIGDWELYPTYAATLRDFVGEPNNRDTADAIHDRLRVAITSSGVVLDEDLSIRVIPVHRHKVLVLVRVDAVPTAFNKLESDRLVVSLVFDFLEQGVFFLDKVPELGV